MKVAWAEITRSNREVKENAHTPADMAQPSGQTMSAMVGADLGHLCAATVMGTVNCPANTGGSGPSPGAAHDDR
jgi:hypothetical protein